MEFSTRKALRKIEQTAKSKTWIDVLFNHVERKVVESTETPDADGKQDRDLPGKRQVDQDEGREQPQDQKKKPFENDQPPISNVHHCEVRRFQPR